VRRCDCHRDWLARRSATAPTTHDAREEEALLQRRRVVFPADSGEVPGRRVAGIAAAFAVEISLTRLRITGEHVLDFKDRRPAQRVIHALMDEMRQLFDLSLVE